MPADARASTTDTISDDRSPNLDLSPLVVPQCLAIDNDDMGTEYIRDWIDCYSAKLPRAQTVGAFTPTVTLFPGEVICSRSLLQHGLHEEFQGRHDAGMQA